MMSEITKTEIILKNNLIRLRNDAHLSKYAVSNATGIDYAYYHRLEDTAVSTLLNFKKLELLADFYQKEVFEFFIPLGELSSPEGT